MEDVEVGGHYSYKGHTYEVIMYNPNQHRVKDPTSGNWHDAVTYMSSDESYAKGMSFTRQSHDFLQKFSKVQP